MHTLAQEVVDSTMEKKKRYHKNVKRKESYQIVHEVSNHQYKNALMLQWSNQTLLSSEIKGLLCAPHRGGMSAMEGLERAFMAFEAIRKPPTLTRRLNAQRPWWWLPIHMRWRDNNKDLDADESCRSDSSYHAKNVAMWCKVRWLADVIDPSLLLALSHTRSHSLSHLLSLSLALTRLLVFLRHPMERMNVHQSLTLTSFISLLKGCIPRSITIFAYLLYVCMNEWMHEWI